MKLFKQLLVAPAALGLLAPLAANAEVKAPGTEVSTSQFEEISAGAFAPMTKISGSTQFTTGFHDTAADTNDNKWTTEYNYKIDINHEFTGDDNLYIGLEAGNQDNLVLEGQVNDDADIEVASLYYTFPIGEFSVSAGPLLDQDDVVSATTSIYSSEFYISELPWGLSGNTGAGVTVAYANENGWNASINALAQNAGAANAVTGMFTEEGTDEYTASIGYDTANWGGGVIYRSVDVTADDTLDSSLAVGFYFRPDDWPTVSIAYDKLDDENGVSRGDFFVGLDYGVGSGTLSAALQANDNVINNDTENKNTIEVYYTYPINDGMDVKAGVYSQELTGGVDNTQGAIVETTFKF